MRYDKPATGLWTTSQDDERWPEGNFFLSKEEAVAFGIKEYAHCDGCDDAVFYVGQITVLSNEEVAEAFIRTDEDADEQVSQQDEWAWCEDALVNPVSLEADKELHRLVTAWVAKHNLAADRWYVRNVEKIIHGS